MDIFRSLRGMAELTVVSPDIGGTLEFLCRQGITIQSAEALDEVTVSLILTRRDCAKAMRLLKEKGIHRTLSHRLGIYWRLKSLLHRPVLILGCLLFLLLTLYLPTKVLMIRVEGNTAVPTRLILETAEQCGLRFGTTIRAIRSEQIKNQLLSQLPQLRWAGVNTYGCIAVISVRERPPEEKTTTPVPSSLVALRDGIILTATAEKGSLLCKPGQAVQQGQILISGFTDCGLTIRAEQAQGEVYAQTERKLRALTPSETPQILFQKPAGQKISLVLGKFRINLWKGSGISPDLCGRMYSEYYVTLPGGFRLPIALSVERFWEYELQTAPLLAETAGELLSSFAERYLKQQMIGGSLLRREETVTLFPDVYILEGDYRCSEMIARVRQEQIGEYHGKNS